MADKVGELLERLGRDLHAGRQPKVIVYSGPAYGREHEVHDVEVTGRRVRVGRKNYPGIWVPACDVEIVELEVAHG